LTLPKECCAAIRVSHEEVFPTLLSGLFTGNHFEKVSPREGLLKGSIRPERFLNGKKGPPFRISKGGRFLGPNFHWGFQRVPPCYFGGKELWVSKKGGAPYPQVLLIISRETTLVHSFSDTLFPRVF